MTTPYTPEQDVVAFLAGASIGLTAGTNLFDGPVLPADVGDGKEGGVPSLAVFVLGSGGPAPMPYMGRQGSLYYYGIQVRTRSNPQDHAAGLALARLVRQTLHEATIPIAAGGDYVMCLVKESNPLFIGLDQSGRSEWSQNLDLRAVESP